MFKSDSKVYIPSIQQAVNPDVVSNVLPGQQIRLNVPSFTGFINPQDSYLKFNLEITNARGRPVPDPSCGVHALFRNVLLRNGPNAITIENAEDYNGMVSSLNHYTAQDSIEHLRELFSGVCANDNYPQANLYYTANPEIAGTTQGNPAANTKAATNVAIQTRLQLGFLQNKVIPTQLLNGLRFTIDVEDATRALRYLSTFGQNGAGTPTIAAILPINSDARGAAAAVTQGTVLVSGVGSSALTMGDNPFDINDLLYVAGDDGSNEEVLGVVESFYAGAAGALGINYAPQRLQGDTGSTVAFGIGSRIFYKPTDRTDGQTFLAVGDAADVGSNVLLPLSFVISEMQYLAESVEPPEAYATGMMNAANSGQGFNMDFLTQELHRFNQSNTIGISQCQIPTTATRCRSVVSVPVPVANYRDINVNSFAGVADNARNYQWVFGTSLQPSRQVELSRYSQALVRPEPLHVSELQKSLININRSVYSLQKIQDHFLIGRAFSKYGQVANLSTNTLSLRIDYTSAATTQKVINSYVYHLRRLSVISGVLSVSS